ncbi:MAG: DUF3383 family protein [Myxococcales bacterium]|nr:DUF3383 family protein [Myxococcales bacterium]USN51649.1 MAG: DUF3383 family protein [Myxococcales bacterium]
MSIDSIVKISIETQSLSMAQKGFGVPLILGFKEAEKASVEMYRNAGELPDGSHASYKMAKAVFSQNPTVPLLKIAFAKNGFSLSEALKSILDIESDFYGVLLSQTPSAKELKEAGALLESGRLILGFDVDATSKDIIKNLKSDRIFCMHNPSSEECLSAAWMGKMLPEAPGSSSWSYQDLKPVAPYSLSASIADELDKAHINRYIGIKGVGVTLDGKMLSGRFIDITRGIDWLHVRIQERLFRLLMINKKIPYTLKGIDLVRSEILAQLKEAIYQGVLAEDPEPMVSVPTIEEVSEQVRGDRVLPKVRFSGRLAGAIHKIEIQGTVTV